MGAVDAGVVPTTGADVAAPSVAFIDDAEVSTVVVVVGGADVAITAAALDATLVRGERASSAGTAPQPAIATIAMVTTDADRQRIRQV